MSSHSQEVKIPTSYLLSQVVQSVRSGAPTASVKVPTLTTWVAALETAQKSLASQDKELIIFSKQTKERQKALRELALASTENLPPEGARTPRSTDTSSATSSPLTIRTNFPKHGTPPRSSSAVRKRLREIALESKTLLDRQPYPLHLVAGITEPTLPTVSGSLRLRGLDADPLDEIDDCRLDITDMLWDTGAHGCVITEDILTSRFRNYLKNPEHDAYRDARGVFVQVDGYLAFTNTTFEFNAVFKVAPASSLPNGRNGVILGQNSLLNRMAFTCISRVVLENEGQVLDQNIWGDINISKYVDPTGTPFTF